MHNAGAGFLPKLGVYQAECDDCEWESPAYADLDSAQEEAKRHVKSMNRGRKQPAPEPAP